MRYRWLLACMVLFATPTSVPAQSGAPRVELTRSRVPAAGRQTAQMTVREFGRYSIQVESKRGVSVQLVNKMSGPSPVHGQPGDEDGRTDVLLDRGTYQIVTKGYDTDDGTAQIVARGFRELHTTPVQLVELKMVHASLDDLEQRSWWVKIDAPRWVTFEAAGRHLADVRLWKDGSWLVDASPQIETITPRIGRPLTYGLLTAQLEPGWYLLTAYGGPSQPWADESDEKPFHLRWGIPPLPSAGRKRYTVGPFGFDRYRLDGRANFVRLELPEARSAELSVWRYQESSLRSGYPGYRAEIQKNTVPPIAEVFPSSQAPNAHLVTVKATEGQPYVLQHFNRRTYHRFGGQGGTYWVSSVHSGHVTDAVDATALVVASQSEPGPVTPLAHDVIRLDRPWSTRSNLLDATTVFFYLPKAKTVEIVSKGTEAQFRIEPYMLSRPRGYESPPFKKGGSKWRLDAGFHVLTMQPIKQGIAEVTVRPAGILDPVLEKLGGSQSSGSDHVQASVRFEKLQLSTDRSYTVYLNNQGSDVRSGLIVRKLPLDLDEPLPLTQQPGEIITVPISLSETGTLTALTEDGSRLELRVDEGVWTRAATLKRGRYTIQTRNTGQQTVAFSLSVAPQRLDPKRPLPAMPDAALASLPKFEVLKDGKPLHFDLDRKRSRSFLVQADEPALYQLQSTGLLRTAGNLRTRTVTSFVRRDANGVGRNFLVQQYLREGDYQLTASTLGKSKGHLGLTLTRTQIVDGGSLTDGVPARIEVEPGDAVLYQFELDEPTTYRVESFGVGRTFKCRLEDADGWPLRAPNTDASFTYTFEPGRYRLMLMPEAVRTRRVTVLTRITEPPRFEGHGPHPLALDRRLTHTWQEPDNESDPRPPDVWEFSVPADIPVRVELTSEMQADLVRLEGERERKVAYVPPMRGWEGELTRGTYRLRATCVRANNLQEYQVGVFPGPLIAGGHRSIYAPGSVSVAVGRSGLVELSSLGHTDVRARLYDADGALVGRSDDRVGDWNFQITRKLPAGSYRLQVDPVGASHASVDVSMLVPEEKLQPRLSLPAERAIRPGNDVHVFPLDTGKDGFLLVAASSSESAGIALERKRGDTWVSLGASTGTQTHLEVPTRGSSYRLRVWSADRRGNPIHFTATTTTPRTLSERRLGRGTRLPRTRGIEPAVAAASVRVDEPGLWAIDGDVRWCPSPDTVCRAPGENLVSTSSDSFWLVAPPGETVTLRRQKLEGGADPVTVRLAPGGRAVANLSTRDPIRVLTAHSMVSQPAATLGRDGFHRTLAVGDRSAAAVSLDGSAAGRVWTAEPATEPEDVRLAAHVFGRTEAARVELGQSDGRVPAGDSVRLHLPKGPKQVRLVAGPHLVGVLASGTRVDSVHWHGGAAFSEQVATNARELTLLNTGDGPSAYTLEVAVADADAGVLRPGQPFEIQAASRGRIRLTARASEPGRVLRVRGTASVSATVVHEDGRVERGTDVPLSAGEAAVTLEHTSGLVVAWIDASGAIGNGLFATTRTRAHDARLPDRVSIKGDTQAIRLAPTEPVLLHLRVGQPMVARLANASHGPDEIEIHPTAGELAAWLPAGETTLTLRALGGTQLSGYAELSTTPVTPIGEGLGPEVILGPGSTRLFSFHVEESGPVGIGVRADADIVRATLMDHNGRPLGSGVVQMTDLQPGTWLLALEVPPDGHPVHARPALAGLKRPDAGPPDEVVRKYLELARASATEGTP